MMTDHLQQFEEGHAAACHLLQTHPSLTAIFALTDALAVGVLRAATELGRHVPRDLSVMGFDDVALAAYVVPALTTVAQPIHAMGQTAAQILLRQMNNPSAPIETVRFETQLVVRASTARPGRDQE